MEHENYQQGYSDACKTIKEIIDEQLLVLETEKVCEYDPAEFNAKPRPLGRWDRLLSDQKIRIDMVKKIKTLLQETYEHTNTNI